MIPTNPSRRADDGAPVDVNEPFDEAIDVESEADTEVETDQVTRAQEGQDEYDDPTENVLNDPERNATSEHVEP